MSGDDDMPDSGGASSSSGPGIASSSADELNRLTVELSVALQRISALEARVHALESGTVAEEEDLFGPPEEDLFGPTDPAKPAENSKVWLVLWHVAQPHPDCTEFSCLENDLIATVRAQIAQKHGYAVGSVLLVTDDREVLHDDRTVQEYGLQDGDIIRVVIRPGSTAPSSSGP
jgi:hypothetical protein